jgi:hypothetical protein
MRTVSKRDSFLLRLSPEMMDALRRWSEDEFRSMNAQIEMVLAEALRKAGRLKTKPASKSDDKPREDQSKKG